jgi:hydroxymethylpyrimidine/phosphomethylpyrimidine kinase
MTERARIPRVLIIAGSDSGGGAGIQADIKTVTMLGGHAMTAVTALTAQNTLGVRAIHPVPTDMVIAQIEAVVCDIGMDAVKIGMIGSAETADAVAEWLVSVGVPVVLDPVMVATSGARLIDDAAVAAIRRLMTWSTLVTPNLPELEVLGGIDTLKREGELVLVKGGHAEGNVVIDQLIDGRGEIARWSNPRIDTPHTHGTGCTLASAIATGLAAGMAVPEATGRAIEFVRAAIEHAPGLGGGHGPMGHALGVAPFDELKH